MLSYMLDANLCIRVLRDRPPQLRERFNEQADSLCISTVVLMELLHGAAKSARPEHNRGEVQRLAAHLEVCRSMRTRPDIRPIFGRFWSDAAKRSARTIFRSPVMPAVEVWSS